MHCVLGFLQVASSNSHSFTAWRGSHSAHFPDGETEAWGVKSSPKLMQVELTEPRSGRIRPLSRERV